MKYECEICAGDFSKSKIIECGYCDLKACRDCNKTYLLSRTDEIHCMGCRNKWNLEFCHKNLTKKFKVIILMENEKATKTSKKKFSAIKVKTKEFQFDREEAHER